MELLPGDFGQIVLGQRATDETVAAFRRELGLDQPAFVRYFAWIGSVLTGDLGHSFAGRGSAMNIAPRAVVDLIVPRLGNTLFLATLTAVIAVPLAIFLGILTALYRNSIYDRIVNAGTLTTISLPEFFLAYLLILIFTFIIFVFIIILNHSKRIVNRLHK